jgi:hypothetical protein
MAPTPPRANSLSIRPCDTKSRSYFPEGAGCGSDVDYVGRRKSGAAILLAFVRSPRSPALGTHVGYVIGRCPYEDVVWVHTATNVAFVACYAALSDWSNVLFIEIAVSKLLLAISTPDASKLDHSISVLSDSTLEYPASTFVNDISTQEWRTVMLLVAHVALQSRLWLGLRLCSTTPQSAF